MSTLREKAIKMLSDLASKEETFNYLYVVTKQVGKRGALENLDGEFCEDCIKDAVIQKKKDWFDERIKKYSYYNEVMLTGAYHTITQKGVIKKITPNVTDLKAHKKMLNRKFKLNTKFSYQCEHADYETNGFRFCESCSSRFNTSLILDHQELEHWVKKPNEDYKNLSCGEAYELTEILESWHDNKFNEVLNKIAKKVILNFIEPPKK